MKTFVGAFLLAIFAGGIGDHLGLETWRVYALIFLLIGGVSLIAQGEAKDAAEKVQIDLG